MLETRGLVPDFDVTTVEGARFAYGEAWQKKNLVLIALPASADAADAAYVSEIFSVLAPEMGSHTVLVVTHDPVAGDNGPMALVADKYGEIYYLAHAPAAHRLPPPRELGDWLHYIRIRCSG